MIKKTYIGLHVKFPLFWSDFDGSWISSTYCRKMPMLNVMKIRPVGVELFPVYGQDEDNSRFSNFCECA